MTEYNLRYRFSASGQADVARAFQSIAAAAAKAAMAEERAGASAERAMAKAARAKAAVEKSTGSPFRDAGRGQSSGADAEAKMAKRAADAKIRENDRALRHVARIRDRHFLDEQRQQERGEMRARTRRSRMIGKLGGLGMDAGLAFGAAAIGAGGAVVGAAARKEFALRNKTRDISISTRGSGQAGVDPEVLAKEFQRTALASPGQTAEGIADAVKAFTTKTGDLATARKMQGTFATLSSASGASAQDIGSASADIMQKFGIKDPEEMQRALGSLYMQGKKGSFELSDAASQFPKVGAAASRFGLDKGAKGVTTLGGLMQIAKESKDSPEAAATSVEAMFRQLVAKSGELKGQGVNVFDAKGNARDIQDVLVETISKVGGSDVEKKKVGLQKVFGEEGIAAVSPLITAFADAVKNGTDPVKALRDKLSDATNVTGGWEDAVEDAATRQSSASAKMDAAWESLSAKVGEAVLPELVKLADSVAKTPGLFSALAGTVGVLAEGFVGLIGLLRKMGLIEEEKPKSTGDALKDAEAEVDKANEPMANGRSYASLTPEEKAKVDKANERYASLAMIEETQQTAMGSGSEEEVRMGIEQIETMGGLSTEEKRARQNAVAESFNSGRGEDQKINFDEASGQLVASADALKDAALAMNEAAKSMPVGGAPGDAPGDPVGGGGRRF